MKVLTEQELVRRKKLEELRIMGVDPFGNKYEVNTNSKDLKDSYGSFTNEKLEKLQIEVSIAGRIMTKRIKGKAGFCHIQDKLGQIQIYVKIDDVSKLEYEVFVKGDLGDIIGVKGMLFKTRTGELTVKVSHYHHLAKALKPLPEKYHGLIDIEERFRKRYVDLIMNENARRIAFIRPKIIRSIQRYLDNLGYIEVETPILEISSGGAAAKPFITYHNTLAMNMYLRIATELPLKKLIVGGMDAVYEIGRLFRNEGMDRNHNPEFTTIEIYKAYSDMEGMIELTENVIKNTIFEMLGTYELEWKGHLINFSKSWKKVHMVDAINEACGIDFFKVNEKESFAMAKKHNIDLEAHYQFGHIVNAFFEKYVEETLIEPTFIIGHPIEISPLAKKSKDERFTERFELFIGGQEYANAFSELNDPIDQRERFVNQLKEKSLGNEEANDMDEDYVEALEYGLPPTGGLGIGIDRLVMLITNSENIKEVILFPHMKNKN